MKTLFKSQTFRVLIKAALLFLLFNYAFALIPSAALWRFSIYNNFIPGSPRFPQEDDLSLLLLNHEIAAAPQDEYNVVVLGHSSTWGYLLDAQETFSGSISEKELKTCNGATIHLYNLGYPKLSTFKVLLILDQALPYNPDAVIWVVTLNSMLYEPKQHPIVYENAEIAQSLIDEYAFPISFDTPEETLWDRTFLNRRATLARFIKYQLDGMRAFVAGEHTDPRYTPIGEDLEPSLDFGGMPPPELDAALLMDTVLNAGIDRVGDVPLVIINEPIQIATGKNSDIRYNQHYPKWAYDQYRELMFQAALDNNWHYFDLWNLLPPTEFTNSAVHRTVTGEKIFADEIEKILLEISCP